MKRTILFAAVAALFSGAAFAAGEASGTGAESEYQSQTRGGTAGQGTEEQTRRDDAAASEYQGVDISELKQRFTELDKDNDGRISYQEAQEDPQFVKYWDERNLSKDQQIDIAEFARFESEMETGANTFQSGEQGLPATKHQEEVTGQDRQDAPGASKSDQERDAGGSRY